ncbi:pre-rRNA-processing protein TSR1 homolog [Nilaparvata lugens]|uniref:pre-rRNA-processing protein TSR1 homolog n=1 Tax=Nilaparvata lugens TaxID=108931 RepID=UPI00193EA9B4|nr:pre-rRNA-processing protein TSR1 homolog [Nilaparvata lugens]
MNLDEEQETLQKIKDARQDQLFPDEVDTPGGCGGRATLPEVPRLQSFRTSPWDAKEDLPRDYARIFQFQNFNRTRKRVMDEAEDCCGAYPGWYISVHIANVPAAVYGNRGVQPVVVFGMLAHEQKMSVVNMVLKRPNLVLDEASAQAPIKSKQQLVFQCGYRRYRACPVFSQHTNGSKHKYERYFQPDATVVATVFAPIMFPPCSVLAFEEKSDGSMPLVATGSLLSVNPDRLVIKRVVLSGHPFKVNKRSAVIRYMFFNREDIAWFKPVELRTKYGRRGHIKEPLGEF